MGIDAPVRCTLSLTLVALLCLPLPAGADEAQKRKDAASGVQRAGRQFVEDARSAGRDLGRDASQVAQEGWAKTKAASGAAADAVRRATHEFWRDLIQEKERLLEKLRRENRELRAQQPK